MKRTQFFRCWGLCLLLGFFSFSSLAQIKINEVLASNASVNTDASGASADWIELFNESDESINLQGYYITDNIGNATKWQIVEETVILPNGFLLIWCDDKAEGLHANFKLSADGEEVALYSPSLELVDSFSFAPQFVDISYGRVPDGGETLRFFMEPTPAASNTTQPYTGCANQPEIMKLGGFYDAPVTVEITQDLGGVVRYTLDGSEPTANSAVYSEPINISKTTVLRTRIFEDGFIPGKTVTASYFIGEGFGNHNLPVVSIATDAENFWDSEKGIYVQDFKPEWEVPVNFELFENNGSDRSAINEAAGIKINGLYSWQLPQKMLGVYFRKQYGEGSLSYRLFFDSQRTTFDNFALRASGNDWSNTMFRDGLLQQACRKSGNMNLDLMAFRPCIVYVNGEFLGVHNIREKVDDNYIISNYGLEEGTFDMIEGGDYVETGDMDAWNSLMTLVNKDLSQQANFDELAQCFDVENFTDYIVAELYSRNTSINHNTMAWKSKGDGKWRWILMDADRGFLGYGSDLLDYYMDKTAWPLAQMMENEAYKEYLCKRIADQLFTTFNPITISRQIDEHQKDIEAVMPQHIQRWLGTTSSYGDAMPSLQYWYDEVEELRAYAAGRPLVLLQDLTDYGCEQASMLLLSSSPLKACTFTFNGLGIDASSWYGSYPKDMPITLTAKGKAGFRFVGWRENSLEEVIAKESEWSYLDDGTNQGEAWKEFAYDDSSWKSGKGILGYNISGVNTTVSYGSSSSRKYITTYFRKSFTVDTPLSEIISMKMNLLREDGAVVYLNGTRILSTNMPASEINYNTLAQYALGSLAETTYVTFEVDASLLRQRENVLAVEVHQAEASSSDLAFDLQLIAEVAGTLNVFVSTEPTCTFSLQANRSLTAVYESTGQNIVPDSINSDLVFYKVRSPYYVQGDVYIAPNATLTIEPGVEVLMAPQSKFMVQGSIQADGTPTDSILFRLNPEYGEENSWGALCFIHATDTTHMSYLELRDATQGPADYNCVAAISAFGAVLRLDHIFLNDIDSNPIATRRSDVRLTNSFIHSNVLGDLINVKYGKGYVENCTFVGNGFSDTDAIDYDGIEGGIIKKVIIRDFEGSNSDAIDIGERAINVVIDSIMAYNITDKGISLGQRSSALVSNSTFIHTNLGLGVKDSSRVTIENCTFFSVGTPVSCYEKVFGRAGGNAIVTHSILSNSFESTLFCDNKSSLFVFNSLSDNDSLSLENENIFGNPQFESAGAFNLSLEQPFEFVVGSNYMPLTPKPELTISEICYNTLDTPSRSEYICLYNPLDDSLNISSYSLSKAVQFTFPEDSWVASHGFVYVAKSVADLSFENADAQVYEWEKGSLANEGEAICLSNENGIIIDQVIYSPHAPWVSTEINGEVMVLSLTDYMCDNHLAQYWEAKPYPALVDRMIIPENRLHYFTYNPLSGIVTFHLPNGEPCPMEIYSLTGQKLISMQVTDGQSVDISTFGQQILVLSVNGKKEKVIVLGK